MQQGDSNRFEEYIALRAELMLLLMHSRQILYWSIAFVILALGWYAGSQTAKEIHIYVFTTFLLLVLAVSAVNYSINTIQVYRIGGYLGVFWDSSDPDRHLLWQRFNRMGPPGGFLPDAAAVVYTFTSLVVLGFFLVEAVKSPNVSLYTMIMVSLINIIFAILFSRLSWWLRNHRNQIEHDWVLIRASEERQQQIHDAYETISPEEMRVIREGAPPIAPPPIQQRTIFFIFLTIAAAGLLAFATLKPLFYPPPPIPSAIDERLENFEQRFDQLEKNTSDGFGKLQQQINNILQRLPKPKQPIPSPPQPKRGGHRP